MNSKSKPYIYHTKPVTLVLCDIDKCYTVKER